MNNSKLDDFINQVNSEWDDYYQSVIGLYAFCISASWDDANHTTRTESILKIPAKVYEKNDKDKKPLTPDSLTIVSKDYSVIAEMKKHFREDNFTVFNQIKAYDCELRDFWTDEEIPEHDLVLLTHMLSKSNAEDALLEWQKENGFERNFAIVAFSYSSQGQTFFTLMLVTGKLKDEIHNEALRKVKAINKKIMVDLFAKYKFYDVRPPIIYTMQIIYDELLPLLIDEDDLVKGSPNTIKISVKEVRTKLQELFVPSDLNKQKNSLPKLEWIIDAFDKFVELELAKKIDRDHYYIKLNKRTKEKDTKRIFAKKIYDLNEKKKNKKVKREPTLFDDVNSIDNEN